MWSSCFHLLEKASSAARGWSGHLRQMAKKKVFHKGIKSSAFSRIKKTIWLGCLWTVGRKLHSSWNVLFKIRSILWTGLSITLNSCPWKKGVCMLMHVYTHTGVAGLSVYSLNLIYFLFWIIDLDTYSSSSWQHPALLYLRSGFWGNPQPTIKSILDHGKAHDGPSVLLSLPPDYLCCSATQVRFCFIIADCCC